MRQCKFPWIKGEKTIVNRFVNTAGITEQEIFDRRQKTINIKNAIWSLCNEYLLKNQTSGNIDNIRALYLVMERIRESEGKTANPIVKRRLYFQLLQYKESGCSIVIVIAGLDSCEDCKKLDGKEFDIDEAIRTQPLPPKDCTCLRCSCSY